jgi:hypothetical protein
MLEETKGKYALMRSSETGRYFIFEREFWDYMGDSGSLGESYPFDIVVESDDFNFLVTCRDLAQETED